MVALYIKSKCNNHSPINRRDNIMLLVSGSKASGLSSYDVQLIVRRLDNTHIPDKLIMDNRLNFDLEIETYGVRQEVNRQFEQEKITINHIAVKRGIS
jgi:hypothetical protein